MYRKLWTTLLALPLIGASCSDTPQDTAPTEKGTIRVTVGSGPRIDLQPQSRTELDDDGVTVRWSDDDRIALWAINDAGETTVQAATFSMWHYNASFGAAKFRGDIPSMSAGNYTYYAVSPTPDAVNGTLASFDIPTVQDGSFNASCDVMVSSPVKGPALAEGDNSDAVRLAFRHKVHVLKIRIPSNALGEKISSLEIAFPQPVTGRLTVDASDPDAEPTLTDASNRLTLRFPNPVNAGATVYATIAPVEIPQNQWIVLTAVGRSCESKPGAFTGKNFAAGHTTPIALHVPEIGRRFTLVSIALSGTGEQTLGEAVESFTLSSDEVLFDNGAHTRTFTVNDQGDYTMAFREFPEELQDKWIDVAFESRNALVKSSFQMPDTFIESQLNPIRKPLEVPYLMEENFSSINRNEGSSDNPGVGGADIVSGDRTGVDLSEWGLMTPGWTSARVGVETGKAVRICARYEGQSLSKNTYNARIDSAPFSALKENASVQVKVSYNYKGGRYSAKMKLVWFQLKDDGPGNGNAIYRYGYTTQTGWIGGSQAIEHPLTDDWIVLPNTEGKDRNQSQTYDNIDLYNEFRISEAGPATRISWMVSSTMNDAPTAGANGNFWLYLDNIKVSIVNQ